MRKVFIESPAFTERYPRHMDEEAYIAFQYSLMALPELGRVIPGCGGLRKVRVGDPRRQKGKRGGARIVYLHVPEVNWVYLVDIYGKDEKDDLSAAEKKVLRQLVQEFRRQALRTRGGTGEGEEL